MKKYLLFALVLILTLSATLTAQAAPPIPGGPFSTAIRVQNLDDANVACSYVFYESSGAIAYTSAISAPIAPGDSLYVYVPNIPGLLSNTYSGVVGCSGAVAAVINFADSNSAASFSGINSAATTWYAPGIYDNYYNYYSSIVVQNASSAPVNISVEIFAPGNPVPVKTQTATAVPANASFNFEQEGLTELSTNVPYSARIIASDVVAPIVTIYGRAGVNDQLYSYNPFLAGALQMFAPVLLNNYYGNNSALVIQNLGSVTTHVRVDYSTPLGPFFQEQNIAGNSAWSIYIPGSSAGLPSGNINGLFSAVVTSTGTGGNVAQNIAILINESNSYNRAASIRGFSSGGTTVVAPTLEKRYYNFNSSMTCQVISGGPASMTIEYFGSGGSLGTITSPVKNTGETHMFYQPNASFLLDGWIGSAKVTSVAEIACIVNQDMNEGSYATMLMDQLQAYEGLIP